MKKIRKLQIIALMAALALVGLTVVMAAPRNQSYTCIDQLNCMMVDEESSPAQDPQFVARIDVSDSRVPKWIFLGSACPGMSRTDILADNAVRGTSSSQWVGKTDGGDNRFVFHSDKPVTVTVYYGRLDVDGGTLTADSAPRAITDGTWRCISRRNPNVPLGSEPSGSGPVTTNPTPTNPTPSNPAPSGNMVTLVDASHCTDDTWAKAQIGTDIQGLGSAATGEDCSWVIRTAPLGAVTIHCPLNWVCTVTVEGKNLVYMGGVNVDIGPKIITAGTFRYAPGFLDTSHKIRQLPPCQQQRDEDAWGMGRNPAYHVLPGNFSCN